MDVWTDVFGLGASSNQRHLKSIEMINHHFNDNIDKYEIGRIRVINCDQFENSVIGCSC